MEESGRETLCQSACRALEKAGFRTRYAADGKAAVAAVLAEVKAGMTAGIGGSMTLQGLGVPDALRGAGLTVLDHNAAGLSPEEKNSIRAAQLQADVFVSGSNAVTLEGEIVNVDGAGNRVAALSYGPKKRIVVVGANKIVADEIEAHDRVMNFAAPLNNKRLGTPNPCVALGRCVDCNLETRICRIYQTLRRKPMGSDFLVIVVGENLGY